MDDVTNLTSTATEFACYSSYLFYRRGGSFVTVYRATFR